MTKKLIAMLAAMFAAMYTLAAVTITTSAKTFQKAGGAASVVVQGDGSWTAKSDSSWIVIKSGASGTGAGSVVYVVNANATADVRIGHINIGGNTYTITQYGYDATISPTSATFDRYGGNGTISVTVDAGVSWSAVANNDWISVSPASGMSIGTVSYTVAEYPGVVSRVGSVTIGGKTFTITQTGVDVSISPESIVKGEDADIIAVTINALATTQWTVTPNDPWISIIDKESGYGDYVLTLAINANPSFERRTGTVSIGTATLTISQAGTTTASLSIDPATATAAASGAYGNVAVYATPDAAWTAESKAPWLTISEGATGAGNGNIKYVASANPTLSERTGQIIITPPYKVIDPDLYRGLVFWITDYSNIEGNDARNVDHNLAYKLNGSFKTTLQGTNLPQQKDDSFTLSFSFKVGELGCVNRLFMLSGKRNWYINEDNDFYYCYTGNAPVRLASFKDAATDVWFTFVTKHIVTNGVHKAEHYFGKKGEALSLLAKVDYTSILPLSSGNVDMGNFVFGYCDSPTVGYLRNGQIGNIRFWNRALSDIECQLIDVNQSAAMSDDDVPIGAPDGVKWDYFPLDGNAYHTKNTSMSATASDTKLTKWAVTEDRYGAAYGAITSAGNGTITISNFHIIFSSSECDATYSFWINVAQVPSSDEVILKRTYAGSSSLLNVYLTASGKFAIYDGSRTTFDANIALNEWHMVTVVGKSEKSLQLFVDGIEIGNIASSLTLGYYKHYSNGSYYCPTFTLGGWNGAADGLTFFHSALTSVQVRELYERQKV